MQIFTRYIKYRKVLGILATFLFLLSTTALAEQMKPGHQVSVYGAEGCKDQASAMDLINVHTSQGFEAATTKYEELHGSGACGIMGAFDGTIVSVVYEGILDFAKQAYDVTLYDVLLDKFNVHVFVFNSEKSESF